MRPRPDAWDLRSCCPEGMGHPLQLADLGPPDARAGFRHHGALRTVQVQKRKYDATAEHDRAIIERVAASAGQRGVKRVHVALAWLRQQTPVTAPIVGATKLSHLENAVGALSVKLTQEEVASLEEPYVPHPVVGPQ
jgi:aryl-alcohol dehydrogenase-like predicted oxidoreductase